jgi:hypothetical protein
MDRFPRRDGFRPFPRPLFSSRPKSLQAKKEAGKTFETIPLFAASQCELQDRID